MNERDYSSTKSTNTKTKTNTKTNTKTIINADALIYGTFHNVTLTQEEHDSLIGDYGRKTVEDYIERVDSYCERTGKTYPNCYLTIREWMQKDGVVKSDVAKYECMINCFPDIIKTETA